MPMPSFYLEANLVEYGPSSSDCPGDDLGLHSLQLMKQADEEFIEHMRSDGGYIGMIFHRQVRGGMTKEDVYGNAGVNSALCTIVRHLKMRARFAIFQKERFQRNSHVIRCNAEKERVADMIHRELQNTAALLQCFEGHFSDKVHQVLLELETKMKDRTMNKKGGYVVIPEEPMRKSEFLLDESGL